MTVLVAGLPAAADAPKYAVEATVIEAPSHGPRICLGVLDSYPPQCGSPIPLAGWRWDRVDDETTANGTTWGEYRLVGTYDGKRFRVTNVGAPRATGGVDDFFATQCETPSSGWVNRDPSRIGILEQAAMGDAARASPDFVTMWPDRSGPLMVQNVAFTGPVEPHRARLEAIWGGPICVLQFERSMDELDATQAALTKDAVQDLRLESLGSFVDEPHNRVELIVIVADRAAQRRVDRAFGKGVVKLRTVLERVD